MKEEYFQNNIIVCIGALICCALWGSAFPCIKIGYSMMSISNSDTASQILYAGFRFTLAGILAIIIASCISKKPCIPGKSSISKILFLCIFQTVLQYLFFYIGLAHTTGVNASIVEATNVFVAIIISGYIFRQEKVTSRKIIGCIVGFLGVLIVNMSGLSISSGVSILGEGFIFISTFAYAFSSVLMKNYSKTENPVMLSGYQFVFGGLIMAITGYLMGGHLIFNSSSAVLMLFWLAFVSAGAYSLWGILLKYNPVSKVAVYGFMNPVFGVILSASLLKETDNLGIKCIIALVLICVGIIVVNRQDTFRSGIC